MSGKQEFNGLEYKELLSEMFPSKYSANNLRKYKKQIMKDGEGIKGSKNKDSSTVDKDMEDDFTDNTKDSDDGSDSYEDSDYYEDSDCDEDSDYSEGSESANDTGSNSKKQLDTIKRKAFDFISACRSSKMLKPMVEKYLKPNSTSGYSEPLKSFRNKMGEASHLNDYLIKHFKRGEETCTDEEDYDEDDSDEDDSDEDNSDEDDEDDYDEDDYDQDEDYESENDNKKRLSDTSNGPETNESDKPDVTNMVYTSTDAKVLSEFARIAREKRKVMKQNNKTSKVLDEMINLADKRKKELYRQRQEKKKIMRNKRDNMKKFSSFVKNKKKHNDFTAFKDYSLEKQHEILEKLEAIKSYDGNNNPQRIAVLDTDIPIQYKAVALRKMNMLDTMEPGSNEHYKLKQWVDAFMRIPFNHYSNLPLTIKDGVDKTHEFMSNAMDTLNHAVYGLNDAKIQIMQMIGQWITNPSALGTAISIKGPMGTGKTTLVKDGISKILGRDFAFIALGGATDSSVLEGHSYTYEGSTWGKIVDILLQGKTMNPVIYFDELDKISNTPKGEEIAHILTHLTDTTQNNQFHDKYFSEIELDLSRCLFIFSYNEEDKVNPILRDRMYKITTVGYSVKEKITIVNDYLLPKIIKEINFTKEDVILTDSVLRYVIERYTDDEKGVRNLKRCIETIYRKLNLFKLMKPGVNLFENDISVSITFPVDVTNTMVDKFIKSNDDKDNTSARFMYL